MCRFACPGRCAPKVLMSKLCTLSPNRKQYKLWRLCSTRAIILDDVNVFFSMPFQLPNNNAFRPPSAVVLFVAPRMTDPPGVPLSWSSQYSWLDCTLSLPVISFVVRETTTCVVTDAATEPNAQPAKSGCNQTCTKSGFVVDLLLVKKNEPLVPMERLLQINVHRFFPTHHRRTTSFFCFTSGETKTGQRDFASSD